MIEIRADRLSKRYGFRPVFSDISFYLKATDSLAVVGRNGSGKTTLLRIIAGLTSATGGDLEIKFDGRRIPRPEVRRRLSYVGPELTLYDALTAWENLKFFATIRGLPDDSQSLMTTLDSLGLKNRRQDYYGAYSSGMKQRLKYAVALLNQPDILLLDEPTANLDEQGRTVVESIISRQKETGLLIIATNEKGEYDFAEQTLRLGN